MQRCLEDPIALRQQSQKHFWTYSRHVDAEVALEEPTIGMDQIMMSWQCLQFRLGLPYGNSDECTLLKDLVDHHLGNPDAVRLREESFELFFLKMLQTIKPPLLVAGQIEVHCAGSDSESYCRRLQACRLDPSTLRSQAGKHFSIFGSLAEPCAGFRTAPFFGIEEVKRSMQQMYAKMSNNQVHVDLDRWATEALSSHAEGRTSRLNRDAWELFYWKVLSTTFGHLLPLEKPGCADPLPPRSSPGQASRAAERIPGVVSDTSSRGDAALVAGGCLPDLDAAWWRPLDSTAAGRPAGGRMAGGSVTELTPPAPMPEAVAEYLSHMQRCLEDPIALRQQSQKHFRIYAQRMDAELAQEEPTIGMDQIMMSWQRLHFRLALPCGTLEDALLGDLADEHLGNLDAVRLNQDSFELFYLKMLQTIKPPLLVAGQIQFQGSESESYCRRLQACRLDPSTLRAQAGKHFYTFGSGWTLGIVEVTQSMRHMYARIYAPCVPTSVAVDCRAAELLSSHAKGPNSRLTKDAWELLYWKMLSTTFGHLLPLEKPCCADSPSPPCSQSLEARSLRAVIANSFGATGDGSKKDGPLEVLCGEWRDVMGSTYSLDFDGANTLSVLTIKPGGTTIATPRLVRQVDVGGRVTWGARATFELVEPIPEGAEEVRWRRREDRRIAFAWTRLAGSRRPPRRTGAAAEAPVPEVTPGGAALLRARGAERRGARAALGSCLSLELEAWARVRTRVSELRRTGSVLEWRGRFGWIEPDYPVDHPEAGKHGWKVYVSERDVDAGVELRGGVRVSFLAYADGDGVGAEDVRLEGAAALGGAFPAHARTTARAPRGAPTPALQAQATPHGASASPASAAGSATGHVDAVCCTGAGAEAPGRREPAPDGSASLRTEAVAFRWQ